MKGLFLFTAHSLAQVIRFPFSAFRFQFLSLRRHYPDQVHGYDLSPEAPDTPATVMFPAAKINNISNILPLLKTLYRDYLKSSDIIS